MCDCEQKNGRLKSIEESIMTLGENFETEINKKYQLEQSTDFIETELKKLENNETERINNEKDPETGKAKYSNQQQRDIALFNALLENTGYIELKDKKTDLINKIKKSNNELEIMSKKLRIAEMRISIEQMRR